MVSFGRSFLAMANILSQYALRSMTILQLNFVRLLTAVIILGLGLWIWPTGGRVVWWIAIVNGTAI